VKAARTSNPDAYNVFLRARHVGRRFTPEDLADAVALYEQALELDPEFADAWVGLAGAYINMATNSYVQPGEGFELARQAANKALAVDADNATAHAHLGWIAMWYDHDLQEAADSYERALALAPADSGIIGNAAILLKGLGHIDEATMLTRYQVARDPLNATAHFNLGLMLIASARWDEAIESLNTSLELSPDYYAARSFIGTALLLRGDIELALDAMRKEPSEPNRWLGLVMVHHASGESAASDTALADLMEKYEEQWAYNIAYVLAYRNDVDAAFEWLDKAVEYGDPGLADIVAEILFTNLHADPRWDALLRRIGRSPEDLRDIEFDVPKPE
jgi:tetratricopeptide (TPR) repeat protein